MAMTHNEAFLQAIIENPDDDAPRLVYADWLEERGDPRGEFIRVQCRLARLTPADPHYFDLYRRMEQLWAAHSETWLQPLHRALAERSLSLHALFYGGMCVPCGPFFDRGFLEGVSMAADHFLTLADVLFRLAPVRKAVLYGAHDHMSALVRSPYLARLRALGLRGQHNDFTSSDFSENPPGPAWFAPIGDVGARVLAASPHLGGLTALDLGFNEVEDAGTQALAACPGLAGLTEFDLGLNRIGDGGARALASSPRLSRLGTLNLAGNSVGYAGARALVTSPHLAYLTRLDLSMNRISPQGLRALARLQLPTRLTVCDLDLRQQSMRLRRQG
jgi:uncharacterized protein (TIGR02996 family)